MLRANIINSRAIIIKVKEKEAVRYRLDQKANEIALVQQLWSLAKQDRTLPMAQ